jgi:GntP family gluconate:H+ symporter
LALGIFLVCGLILYLRVNAFLALVAAALVIGLLSPRVTYVTPKDGEPYLSLLNVPEQIAQAFGRTMGQIGIVIALATIVGRSLMESGAADRIVRSTVRLFGERLTPVALVVSSYILGVPVFFDTVFLLMAPLAKALFQRTGKDYLLYICAIAAGASITHSLVPPTPGPLTVAARLQADLGLTILAGLAVAAPLALAGLAYGSVANRWWPAQPPLPAGTPAAASDTAEPVAPTETPEDELPSLWVSLLPVVLPVVLISSFTGVQALARVSPGIDVIFQESPRVSLTSILGLIGNKDVALLISAVVAMGIVYYRKRMTRAELGRFTGSALDEAGMILLITSAGGAFGSMLEKVGVGSVLGQLASLWGIPLLVLGWAIAALLKAAQGSATVAMITAADILRSILNSQLGLTDQAVAGMESSRASALYAQYLGYHPVWLVMAIGCGSKIGSWMNDSGFWVVCKAGGLTEGEALRSWTMVLVTMGLLGLPVTALLAWLMPLG